jgi:hypothetical protein
MKCRHCLLMALLFLWGTVLCLFYGRMGFVPLDQSIVFDGGWRIISGQVPFRDFSAPNNVVPIVIQGLFFKVLGVNWFAYCLHAAIFNGLFCLLTFSFLRLMGGSTWVSAFYAFLSGVIFYPPLGVPFMDQHAFFFVLLTLWLAVWGVKTHSLPQKLLSWIFLPIATVVAFLSKQIPTLFAVPVVVIIVLVMTGKKHFKTMLAAVLSSTAGMAIVLAMAIKLLNIDIFQMKSALFDLPSRMGRERIADYILYSPIHIKLNSLFYPFSKKITLKLHSFDLIYISVLAVLVISILSYLKLFPGFKMINIKGNYRKIALALSLLVICNLFILWTLNQAENGIPFLFISLGLVHIAIFGLLSFRIEQKKAAGLKYVLIFIFLFVAVLDAYVFNKNVNSTRMVNEFEPGRKFGTSSDKLPSGFKFIDFGVPLDCWFPPMDFKRTVEYLKSQKANFFLLGDSSIIYGLTGRPSVNPVLWFHPGYTMPLLDSDDFYLYEERLLENIQKYKVKYLVLERSSTFFDVSLNSFKKLASLIIENSAENREFGKFKILRVDRRKGVRQAGMSPQENHRPGRS